MKFISKPFSEEVRVVRGICFVLRICMSRSWSSRPLESLFDACLSDLRSVESLWSIRQIHFHEQGWSVIARLALLLFFGWSPSSLCRRYRPPDVLQKEMRQLIIIASALMFFYRRFPLGMLWMRLGELDGDLMEGGLVSACLWAQINGTTSPTDLYFSSAFWMSVAGCLWVFYAYK